MRWLHFGGLYAATSRGIHSLVPTKLQAGSPPASSSLWPRPKSPHLYLYRSMASASLAAFLGGGAHANRLSAENQYSSSSNSLSNRFSNSSASGREGSSTGSTLTATSNNLLTEFAVVEEEQIMVQVP